MTQQSITITALHPRNLHRGPYDLKALTKTLPALKEALTPDHESVRFEDPCAVQTLNKALLLHFYDVKHWNLPKGALCPAVPGRMDYIHWLADLIKAPKPDTQIKLLDIGTGASGIYALLAAQVYHWQVVGSDIEQGSLDHLQQILNYNPLAAQRITLLHQPDKHAFFKDVIQEHEFYHASCCNPPFYESQEQAQKANQKKRRNLFGHQNSDTAMARNFSGQDNELWCKGGEALFIKKMIKESQDYAEHCGWFTTLLSQQDNIKAAQKTIKKVGAKQCQIIPMIHGNKKTRCIAWRFLDL